MSGDELASMPAHNPLKKKNVYIKLAEAVSMRCEEKLRGRSEYPITNTDMVHPP